MAHKTIPFEQRTSYSLRISELPPLGRCPGFALAQVHREGSTKAADTGSMAGRIIELFHKNGGDAIALEAATRQACVEAGTALPHANQEEAIRVASMYALDNRNWGCVRTDSLELEVNLTLDPAPEDPTQRPIILQGHLDQIREDKAGRLRIWDVKNGSLTGLDLLYGYAWQLAAYSLAATEHYKKPVYVGGIIRLQGYTKSTLTANVHECNVFYQAQWSLEACKAMMLNVAQHVAWIRSGIIHKHPGAHCVWCPAGGPHLCEDYIADAYPKGVVL